MSVLDKCLTRPHTHTHTYLHVTLTLLIFFSYSSPERNWFREDGNDGGKEREIGREGKKAGKEGAVGGWKRGRQGDRKIEKREGSEGEIRIEREWNEGGREGWRKGD